MNQPKDQSPETTSGGADTGTAKAVAPRSSGLQARRKLIRAGLAAAPVGLALTGRSALATYTNEHHCVRPSSYASLAAANMNLSRQPYEGYSCKSHGYWKNNGSTTLKAKKFLGTGTGCAGGFTYDPGSEFTAYTTLQNVLDKAGGTQNVPLARHLVACWLSAHVYGDDSSVLTKAQCYTIWNNQGNWSPSAGVTWTLTDTMNFFNYMFSSV